MNNLEILTFPLFHRISCNGYLIREIRTSIRLRKDSVEELQLSPDQLQQLQQGKDIEYKGRIIENQALAYPPAPAESYAYCSDTRYEEKLLSSIKGVSVLYHETTFMNDKILLAEQTGHTTAGEAGKMAAAAGVSCLITGHYSSRYKDVRPLVAEANISFPHVLEAVEGKKYNIRNLAKGLKE
jgi:ribonuclease Z